MSITKEQILNFKDINVKEIEVKEWNCKIFIKEFTGAEYDQFLHVTKKLGTNIQTADMTDYHANICIIGICDENGNRLFDEKDIKALSNKKGITLQKIANEIVTYNTIVPAKIEEFEKN